MSLTAEAVRLVKSSAGRRSTLSSCLEVNQADATLCNGYPGGGQVHYVQDLQTASYQEGSSGSRAMTMWFYLQGP